MLLNIEEYEHMRGSNLDSGVKVKQIILSTIRLSIESDHFLDNERNKDFLIISSQLIYSFCCMNLEVCHHYVTWDLWLHQDNTRLCQSKCHRYLKDIDLK